MNRESDMAWLNNYKFRKALSKYFVRFLWILSAYYDRILLLKYSSLLPGYVYFPTKDKTDAADTVFYPFAELIRTRKLIKSAFDLRISKL